MRFFYRIFLFITLLGLASCNRSPQQTQMRIVDLQGNPHNVKMRTPDLNMQALAAQGNLSEEKIKTQPNKSDEPPMAPVASNKYSDSASSSEAIKNTLRMPTDPQQVASSPAQEINEADILTADNGVNNKERTIEYSLHKNKSEPAAIAIKDEVVTKKQKGIFVQTGSFSVLQRATNSLEEIQKFASKATPATIEEAQSGDKTVYRVLIGPFPSKQKATATIAKLTKSGHQAIIVKNK
ncbi:MAG: SPOR domain-containing protein [Rickettsiales bacterium]|nr:SPOR domain-containing protein [Rickettsiales bacterium]